MNTEHDNDDILLSAYLDNELPADEVRALESRLLNEPGLQRRLETLRGSDAVARELFAAVDEEPMPAAVLDLLAEARAVDKADNVVALRPRNVNRFLQAPVAIAASVALLAGIVATNLYRTLDDATAESIGPGIVSADSRLHDLLDESPSGDVVALDDAASGEVLLSFADASGRHCRQVRVTARGRDAHALACRAGSDWEVRVVALADPVAAEFGQASSAVPAAVETAVDRLIGDGQPLDPAEEMLLISEGWKKSSD